MLDGSFCVVHIFGILLCRLRLKRRGADTFHARYERKQDSKNCIGLSVFPDTVESRTCIFVNEPLQRQKRIYQRQDRKIFILRCISDTYIDIVFYQTEMFRILKNNCTLLIAN